MFEQEINETIQRIARDVLQERTVVPLTEILEETRIPDRFKAFFETEAQWWIYTESVARARDRRFDFSHPEISSLLSYLEQIQVRHARFERDDFIAVLDSAVKLTYNYLCRPQTTLKWYVFRGEPTKSIGETLLRMDAFVDYPYFRTVFAEWVDRKKSERPTFDSISAKEFERIIRRVDDQILLSCTIDDLLGMMNPLFDFVGKGEAQSIPIEAMIVFFDDKNIRKLVDFLERERKHRSHVTHDSFILLMEELLSSSDEEPEVDFSSVYQDDALDDVVRRHLGWADGPVEEEAAREVARSAAERLDDGIVLDAGESVMVPLSGNDEGLEDDRWEEESLLIQAEEMAAALNSSSADLSADNSAAGSHSSAEPESELEPEPAPEPATEPEVQPELEQESEPDVEADADTEPESAHSSVPETLEPAPVEDGEEAAEEKEEGGNEEVVNQGGEAGEDRSGGDANDNLFGEDDRERGDPFFDLLIHSGDSEQLRSALKLSEAAGDEADETTTPAESTDGSEAAAPDDEPYRGLSGEFRIAAAPEDENLMEAILRDEAREPDDGFSETPLIIFDAEEFGAAAARAEDEFAAQRAQAEQFPGQKGRGEASPEDDLRGEEGAESVPEEPAATPVAAVGPESHSELTSKSDKSDSEPGDSSAELREATGAGPNDADRTEFSLVDEPPQPAGDAVPDSLQSESDADADADSESDSEFLDVEAEFKSDSGSGSGAHTDEGGDEGEPENQAKSGPEDVRNYIDAMLERKVVKKIFNRNRESYEATLNRLNSAETWREASRILDELFIRFDVDPYSRIAIRFTDCVYGRYLSPVG